MASVSGSLRVKVVPVPGVERSSIDARELADGVAHDVHADAAAADVGDPHRGREAGAEDEVEHGGVVHCGQLLVAGQPLLARFCPQARRIDAGAVVAHFDEDLIAAVVRRERDHALVGLAGGAAGGGCLETVVDGVAHQVQERIVELLDEHLVELGVVADDLEAGALLQRVRQLAHRPVVLGEDARRSAACAASSPAGAGRPRRGRARRHRRRDRCPARRGCARSDRHPPDRARRGRGAPGAPDPRARAPGPRPRRCRRAGGRGRAPARRPG